jgi:hypothetical protein
MPKYYRCPLEAESNTTRTDYFAVLGPHAPWGKSIQGVRQSVTSNPDEILLVELPGLKTQWIEPRDMTLEQLLDILRRERGNTYGGDDLVDIMYITVSGEVRTVDPRTDRESLRKLFLGATAGGARSASDE